MGAEPSDPAGPSKPLASGLHLVATPIGNAADITLRALDVLARVDAIACEDTRVTARLLAIHGISRPLVSYHDHNADRVRPRLIERLKNGERVALVADAGTPLVSDPGHKLVRACVEAGIAVTAAPGPSAVLTALQLSALPTDRFLFAGFLPARTGARRRALAGIAAVPATLVFLESARRLGDSLADMASVLGAREAAVARELTKLFEEVRRGPLADLAAHYRAAGPPKGEVTVVVAPATIAAAAAPDVDALLDDALSRLGPGAAASEVAAATGVPRRDLYRRALARRR